MPHRRKHPPAIVAVALNGGRVTSEFRTALFDAANRAGMSVNEFVLTTTAKNLKADGAQFRGVFRRGDITDQAA